MTALQYLSECKQEDDGKVVPKTTQLEEIQEEKMHKIKAYRAYMKSKATVNSRNVNKKEHETVKKGTSSKTESGIGGASTRESQN